MIYLTPKS
ncbi:cfe162fe-6b2c-4908-82d9-94e09514963f [Thermothielavioides terrestris]|uniref:Cfe162fe-6b2c-4908-82d9-94e09514963f n=1 Tax=Thermothielavioides terrestris TaxID=2587410 RepID=A0A3S5CXY2_9PEZI|nr:cfe162fe-6b2c-4908-82d9-94e09514963f [Thermothielavioides terrestris]